MVTGTVREEERAALQQQRRLERGRKTAERNRATERSRKLQAVVREEMSRPRARACKCGITSRTTMSEIMAMGAGCTAGANRQGGWVCSVLDAIRRKMGH